MAFLILVKPGRKARVFPLIKPTTAIGRRPVNDIILEDPFVSRTHAEVTLLEDGSYTIRDRGGTHPVRVNGRPAAEQNLRDGDRVQIGSSTLLFKLQEPSPEAVVEFQAEPDQTMESVEIAAMDARQALTLSGGLPGDTDIHQLRKDHQRLMLLYDFGRNIHSHLEDTHLVLENVMDMAFKTLEAERGFLALVKEAGGELECEIVRDPGTEGAVPKLSASSTIVHKVLREGVSVLTEDALKDTHFGEAKSVQEYEIRSALCVPLFFRDKVLGVIYLDNRRSSGRFDRDDLVFLNALSQLAGIALGNAALHRRVIQENMRMGEALKPHFQILGTSEEMEKVYTTIRKTAPSSLTVLIEGETGTGKELAARAIHEFSERSGRPFVPVNCAAIPKDLIESELFGYEKGAFTGATASRDGKFKEADGGTIFLDEVADMSLDTQAKVLRVLEQREFPRVGGSRTFQVDVRVIAATNKVLQRAVEEGNFREDLYYRLNVVSIHLPPLRERKNDIPILAEHFIAGRVRKIAPRAMEMLLSHRWPGNIRELRNCIDRAVILGNGEIIQPEDLPPSIRGRGERVPASSESIEHVERDHITRVLRRTGWRKSEAAKILGITRQTLDNKIKKYKIRE
ncbi:MAG: sigma 54-interacting transcriptional regulator [Candidatus Aminicenantes bacterium]|nr:sigma 54-interacting transcriptional regulator [Candidatus Aminicenantes bacterium]